MKYQRAGVLVLALFVAVSLAPRRLAAQEQNLTTGGITGTVVDPNNAIIARARVMLRNNVRGTTEEARTNSSGAYQFILLEPGAYTITVEASGYQVANKQVNVTVGEPILVNFQLAVVVKGGAPAKPKPTNLLEAETGNRGTTLTPQQITELPNPGNDITYLAQIVPGVLMNTESGTGHFVSTGTSTASSRFTVNGMNDNEPFLNVNNSGANKLLLGSNEIQEVTVTTEDFSGKAGDYGGATVNYVTKSGEGGLHGDVNYFWNGRKLNANSWLNNQAKTARPFDNVNQWSGAVGGPLKRNKMFFYFNNEGLHVVVPTTQQVIVPSPQFEGSVVQNLENTLPNSAVFYCANGITVTPPSGIPVSCPSSGGVVTNPSNVSLGDGIFNLYNTPPAAANATDILPPSKFPDPNNASNTIFTGDGCGTFTGDSNFGVSIPNGQPGPTNLLPCALAYQSNASNLSTDMLYTARVDYVFGLKDRAYVRYQRDTGKEGIFTDPFVNRGLGTTANFNAASHFAEHQGQLQETHEFSNAAVNQFQIAAQWFSNIIGNTSSIGTTTRFPAQLHFADGSFTDLGGIQSTVPQGRNSTQIQISDDFSRTWSETTLKMGGAFRRLDVSNHDFGRNTVPFLEVFSLNDFFNGGATGDSFTESFPLSTNLPMAYYGASGYFEDDWHASPSLAITFVIRGAHDSNPICRYLCFSRLKDDFSRIANRNNGQALGDVPYSKVIANNQERAFPSYQSIQWDPRVSFAWRPYGGSSRTVVRGGAGLFHELFPAIVTDSLASNPPQLNSFTILSNNIAPSEANNVFAAAAQANSAFVSGFATGQTLSEITTAPGVTTFFQPGISVTDKKMKTPEYQKWNLEVQRQFKVNTIVSAGIVGTHGVHLPLVNNSANAFGFFNLPAGTVPPPGETYPTALTKTFPSGQCSGTSTACTGIDPRFSQVTVISNSGSSNYNAAIATFQHRFVKLGNGIVLASYTFSKAHDDVSNGGFLPFNAGENPSLLSPQDPYNFRGAYGLSDFDARHNVSASYVWELPLQKLLGGRGPSRLVNGWQIAGTVFYRTGFPFSVTDGKFSSSLASNDYFSTILPTPTVKIPIVACSKSAAGSKGKPCLPISAFPATGLETAFSTGVRNLFRGPNYFNTDFSIVKDTPLPGWHSAHLILGLQAFNVLNHPNFDLPIADISNPLFGTIQQQVSSPTSILGSFPGSNASARMVQIKGEIRF